MYFNVVALLSARRPHGGHESGGSDGNAYPQDMSYTAGGSGSAPWVPEGLRRPVIAVVFSSL